MPTRMQNADLDADGLLGCGLPTRMQIADSDADCLLGCGLPTRVQMADSDADSDAVDADRCQRVGGRVWRGRRSCPCPRSSPPHRIHGTVPPTLRIVRCVCGRQPPNPPRHGPAFPVPCPLSPTPPSLVSSRGAEIFLPLRPPSNQTIHPLAPSPLPNRCTLPFPPAPGSTQFSRSKPSRPLGA